MKNRRGLTIFLFILIMSELIGYRLWAVEEAGGEEMTVVYFLLSLAASLLLSHCLSFFIVKLGERFSRPTGQVQWTVDYNRCFFMAWVGLFVCYLPCFLAFYPGIYNNDMVWQWAMYAMENYSAHHPILHTYLTGTIFELGKTWFGSYNAGLAIHSIFQLLVLSGSLAFALRHLIKTGCSKRILGIVLLFYAIYPYIPVMGISTTKDTIFASAFLIMFLCLCEMVQERKIYSGIKLILFLSVMILAGMFRNNALYGFLLVVFGLIIWSVILKRRRQSAGFSGRLALLLLTGILLAQAGLMGADVVFRAEKGKINEMLSVPCQQLARTFLHHGGELTEEEREALFSFIPEENLQNYVYYISDPVKNYLSEERVKAEPAKFVKLWLSLLVKHPDDYMRAFLTNTFGVWYLTGDAGSNIPYEYLPFFDDEHVFTEDSRLPALKSVYKWFQYENYEKYLPVLSIVFYTPFFNWMTLFSGFVIVDKRRFYLLPLPLFLLSYIFTILLGPCVAVRYLFNIILCAPILLAAVWKTEPHSPD